MTPSQIMKSISLASDLAKPSTLPILSHLVIGNNQVVASDIDSQITIKAPFDFEPYTVPAAKFKGILATLADVPMALTHKDGKLSIKSGRSKFTCPTLPSEDFPMMEIGDVTATIQMDQSTLKNMLHTAQHAIPNADVRAILNGALLDFNGSELSVVGTDGFRMAWTTTPIESSPVEAVIPHRAVQRIIKLLDDGPVTLSFYEGKLSLTTDTIEFITKLVSGKYPNWRRIIPKNPNQVQIDIELLKETINRASTVLHKVRSARITIKDTFAVECSNNGELASDDFPIQWAHEEYVTGMNPDYLRDALSVMPGDEITLHIGSPTTAWLMESAGVRAVVMPLRN